MSGIVKHHDVGELFVQLSTIFDSALEQAPTVYTEAGGLVTTVPSTTKKNIYQWLGQAPSLTEWIGNRNVEKLRSYNYELENKKFANAISLDEDDLSDDQLTDVSMAVRGMGEAAAAHPDEQIWSLVEDGETETGYDGVAFFSTAHPNDSGANQVNLYAGAGPAWYLMDTRSMLKGLIWQVRRDYRFKHLNANDNTDRTFHDESHVMGVDARVVPGFGLWQKMAKSSATLDAAGLEAAYDGMRALKNDKGRPLNVRANVLMVPTNLRSEAMTLLNAERDSSGATNINRNLVDTIVVNPYLATS